MRDLFEGKTINLQTQLQQARIQSLDHQQTIDQCNLTFRNTLYNVCQRVHPPINMDDLPENKFPLYIELLRAGHGKARRGDRPFYIKDGHEAIAEQIIRGYVNVPVGPLFIDSDEE